jgi:hypothetical protein
MACQLICWSTITVSGVGGAPFSQHCYKLSKLMIALKVLKLKLFFCLIENGKINSGAMHKFGYFVC